MSLNQPLGLELRIRVRHRSAMHSQHPRQFAACRDAVARAQIARVHQRPQLVAQLDIQRNVAFRLEMYRKHWLSPKSQFYTTLACYKSQFVSS